MCDVAVSNGYASTRLRMEPKGVGNGISRNIVLFRTALVFTVLELFMALHLFIRRTMDTAQRRKDC
jgi:hypothetical protein